ncbi:MAG: hypothetical protein U0414_14450 [Polyangiaceae bacterium]
MSRSIDLRAVFGALLLGVNSCAGTTGCACPPPSGHIKWVPFPPSGEGPAALAIDCQHACGQLVGCQRTVSADGTPGVECGSIEERTSCGAGRRPLSMAGRARAPRRGWGAHVRARDARTLAELAMLESASVTAFEELARHLEVFGAPADLERRARAAAVEEARHARTMLGLARRAGVRSKPVRLRTVAPPTLLELGIANAVEGCAFETFGALLAHHQARTATDRRFREAMAVIAEEETSHAELSRDVDAWIRTRLDAHAIEAMDRAHRDAWRVLARPRATLASRRLGLPCAGEQARLAHALGARVT